MAAQSLGQASAMAADQGKAAKAKGAIFALIDRQSAIDPLAAPPTEEAAAGDAVVAVAPSDGKAPAPALPLLPTPSIPCTGRIVSWRVARYVNASSRAQWVRGDPPVTHSCKHHVSPPPSQCPVPHPSKSPSPPSLPTTRCAHQP